MSSKDVAARILGSESLQSHRGLKLFFPQCLTTADRYKLARLRAQLTERRRSPAFLARRDRRRQCRYQILVDVGYLSGSSEGVHSNKAAVTPYESFKFITSNDCRMAAWIRGSRRRLAPAPIGSRAAFVATFLVMTTAMVGQRFYSKRFLKPQVHRYHLWSKGRRLPFPTRCRQAALKPSGPSSLDA